MNLIEVNIIMLFNKKITQYPMILTNFETDSASMRKNKLLSTSNTSYATKSSNRQRLEFISKMNPIWFL